MLQLFLSHDTAFFLEDGAALEGALKSKLEQPLNPPLADRAPLTHHARSLTDVSPTLSIRTIATVQLVNKTVASCRQDGWWWKDSVSRALLLKAPKSYLRS